VKTVCFFRSVCKDGMHTRSRFISGLPTAFCGWNEIGQISLMAAPQNFSAQKGTLPRNAHRWKQKNMEYVTYVLLIKIRQAVLEKNLHLGVVHSSPHSCTQFGQLFHFFAARKGRYFVLKMIIVTVENYDGSFMMPFRIFLTVDLARQKSWLR